MSLLMKLIAAVISYEIAHVKQMDDLGDLGNEIGIVIQRYFDDEPGFNLDSFINGVKHGVSLGDGTHDKKDPACSNDDPDDMCNHCDCWKHTRAMCS